MADGFRRLGLHGALGRGGLRRRGAAAGGAPGLDRTQRGGRQRRRGVGAVRVAGPLRRGWRLHGGGVVRGPLRRGGPVPRRCEVVLGQVPRRAVEGLGRGGQREEDIAEPNLQSESAAAAAVQKWAGSEDLAAAASTRGSASEPSAFASRAQGASGPAHLRGAE